MSILRLLSLRSGARRHEWLLIWSVGLAAGVLGLVGYAQSTGTLDTIYNTIKLYSFGYADVDNAPWELQVARFLAPAAIVIAGAKALVALFQARIEDGRIRRSRDHVVICGLGRRGLQLVDTFRQRGDRIVAVELDPSDATVAAARARGAMVLVGDATDETVLRHARADRARCVIAVCAADRANLEIATIVDRVAARDGRARTTVVQVADDELARALAARAVDLADPGEVALEVVNVFERGARALLRRHPLLGSDGIDALAGPPPHLVVVGLGRMGGALLLGAARLWEALGAPADRRLQVTVVDPAGAGELARLRLRHPRLAEACEIVPVAAAVGTPEFEAARFLSDDARPPVTAVYVCLEDEEAGVRAGLTLLRRLGERDVPVVVQVASSTASAARLLSSGDGALALPGELAVFGLIEETSTPELLLDNTSETIAHALHEEYLRGQLAAGAGPWRANVRPWEELDEAVREDNRAQGRHVGLKLDAIGCSVRPLDDWGAAPTELDAEEVERLARLEHERWCAARAAAGWRPGARDDAGRRHPDLVPWDALGERSRELNRRFARALPRLLVRAGFQIVRDGPRAAAIEAPAPAGAAA